MSAGDDPDGGRAAGRGAEGAPPRPRPGLRPRYVRRVTGEHVRERVSIRHLVEDPDGGPVPTDVVGRLLSFDDEMLLVVDRDHRLHVIDTQAVLASRVIPPHPRLPAEPDLGTEDRPLRRDAARVLVVDPSERVLLVAHAADAGRRVWTAPGGGLEPGEDHEAAARRELREEIGLQVPIGAWVLHRRARFTFRGVWLEQRERWFLARAPEDAEVTDAPLDDIGALAARWWSLREIAQAPEPVAPPTLGELTARFLQQGPPAEPIEIGD